MRCTTVANLFELPEPFDFLVLFVSALALASVGVQKARIILMPTSCGFEAVEMLNWT